jgi:hypothetical protein
MVFQRQLMIYFLHHSASGILTHTDGRIAVHDLRRFWLLDHLGGLLLVAERVGVTRVCVITLGGAVLHFRW